MDSVGFGRSEREHRAVIADKALRTEFVSVKPGNVAGVRQFARGVLRGREVVQLELQMYVGAPNPATRSR